MRCRGTHAARGRRSRDPRRMNPAARAGIPEPGQQLLNTYSSASHASLRAPLGADCLSSISRRSTPAACPPVPRRSKSTGRQAARGTRLPPNSRCTSGPQAGDAGPDRHENVAATSLTPGLRIECAPPLHDPVGVEGGWPRPQAGASRAKPWVNDHKNDQALKGRCLMLFDRAYDSGVCRCETRRRLAGAGRVVPLTVV